MAAGPASRNSYSTSGHVNDSPYSRILEEIDAEARHSEDVTISTDEDHLEGVESDDEEISEEENCEPCKEVASKDEDCANSKSEATQASLTSRELAQIQKKQAWLRGGQGEAEKSDTASIRSAKKKSTKQPGLLELLFLPKTSAVPHKSSSSRPAAATRPAARRRRTIDVSTAPEAASIAEPASTARKQKASLKSKERSGTSKRSETKSATPATPSPSQAKVECITCLDELSKHRTALLECKHRMCHSCLRRIFTLSTTDPQLMPPRCCTDNMIPLRHVDKLFDLKFKDLWNRKYSEYTTKHRLYCPTKNCGKWIKPKHIEKDHATGRKRGTCKECKTKVCQKCGLKWHAGRECENDESTQNLISMGKEEGWQRCYSCRAMVQLSEGCNHMRCRCNAEFCMVCGQKWKTCDCPWFNLPPELGDLPPELGVERFLVPGGFPPPPPPPPPLNIRIGDLPPPPPLLEGFEGFLNGVANRNGIPLPFRDRRDMPLDPLNPGDLFRPSDLLRPREQRRRIMPAVPLSSREQEAADEEMARRLQDQEYVTGDLMAVVNDLAAERRRASRRHRRRVYDITEDDDEVHELTDHGGGSQSRRYAR